jgi:hypothetical protein
LVTDTGNTQVGDCGTVTVEKESDGRTLSVLFGVQEDPTCAAIQETGNSSALGPAIGGSIGGAVAVVVGLIAAVYFVRRWRASLSSKHLKDKLSRTNTLPEPRVSSLAQTGNAVTSPAVSGPSKQPAVQWGANEVEMTQIEPEPNPNVFDATLTYIPGQADFTFDEAP